MIYLKQNTINDVALTLNEQNPITGSTLYNFTTRHINTNTTLNFSGVDISTNPCRYNQFLITVTGSTFINLSASTVSLVNGYHDYTLTNISGNTLETGLLFVTGTTVAVPTFTIPTTKKTINYER